MPKAKTGTAAVRQTRRTTAPQAPPRPVTPVPAGQMLKQATHSQLTELAKTLEQQHTPCLVCPPDENETLWPAGPAGPRGFLETVADPPDTPHVLSWPTSPERYIEACESAVHQDIRKLNDRKIQLGPQPARRYSAADRNLHQWGICARCRQQLSELYNGPERDRQNAAVLRWGLAAYIGRICVTYRWQTHSPLRTDSPPLAAQGLHNLSLVMEQTKPWRNKGGSVPELMMQETAVELPLRIAGYMPAWQESATPGAPQRVTMAAVWPETVGISRALYPHRLVAGRAADSADDRDMAETAVQKLIRSISALLSSDIKTWLPELGGYWEYLYLSPADYASKKRVPPRVKRLMEAACGQRLNNA